jgi:hypothetical protein
VLNFTAVAPVKLDPVMTTTAPAGAIVGEKLVIKGSTEKLVELVAVPAGLVTLILPVVAPIGAVAVIDVAETTVKVIALTPLKLTAVAPVKFVPVMETDAPTAPLVGVNDEMVGALNPVTVKLLALVAVPAGATTLIGPLVAEAETVALIEVAEATVKLAALMPLN